MTTDRGRVMAESLREAVARLGDRLSAATVQRVDRELARRDPEAAADVLAAELSAHRPTVTWAEWDLLHGMVTGFPPDGVDGERHPHLRDYRVTRYELPVAGRGDDGRPSWTIAECWRAFEAMVTALSDRLDATATATMRDLVAHREYGLAFSQLLAALDGARPRVTTAEHDVLRRVLLFYDADDDPAVRAEDVLAALPVVDS